MPVQLAATITPLVPSVTDDGRATLGVVTVGAMTPPPWPGLAWSASRYAPKPDGVAHSAALSTLVPSPHSSNVVMSWNGAFDATMSAMSWVQAVKSRARRGVASPAFQKPGLMVNE